VHLIVELGDSYVTHVEPAGYGQISTGTISVINNMFNTDDIRIRNQMTAFFFEAQGVYWHRAWCSFNPLYWIQTILYLPREVIEYVGLPTEHWTTKVFQLIYWVGSVILALHKYLEPIDAWLKHNF
jgi:hypothetical protein